MWDVLLVEDDPAARRLIERALEASPVALSLAASIAEARARLDRCAPDLVLLDVGLPDGDGYHLCAQLRAEEALRDVPVIFLTARSDSEDKVAAFALGADDFVEKPFDPLELRARVEARLRKAAAQSQGAEVLKRGPLRLHVAQYRAYRVDESEGELDLGLTPLEFRLLHRMATHPERVFSRGQLLEAGWGDVVVSDRTVDTHISNLRRKLGPARDRIVSVRGVGYRFRGSAAS